MSRLDRTNAPHHVYRCFDAEGRLVYVGSTGDLFSRLAQHRATSWWAPTVAKVKAEFYATGVLAREVERRAIRDEVPRWNKAGKWAGRHLWTRQDWLDWMTVLLHGTNGAPRYLPTSVATAISTYESLFCEPIPEPFASRIQAVEDAASKRRAQEDVERKRRQLEMERKDELSLARERRDRSLLGIAEDCICTLESLVSRRYDDDCDAHRPSTE